MVDFKHIDSRVYADDEPLNTFQIVRTHNNLQAVLDNRPISATWVPGVYDTSTGALLSPDVSYFQGQGSGRAVAPLLIWLPRRAQTVRVEVEHTCYTSETGGGDEVTLSASIQTRSQWSRSVPSPVEASTTHAGGASSSDTEVLDLDVSSFPDGWAVVRVGVVSGEGSAVEIQDAGGSGSNVLTGHYSGYFVLDNAAQHGGANGLPAGTQIPHWAIQILDSGGKASANLGSQFGRQALFLEDNGSGSSRFLLFVYPPVSVDTPHASGTDAVWYTPLGATQIGAVTLTVYDAGSLDDLGAATDASQPASVANLQPNVVSEAVNLWLGTPKIHCLGVSPNVGAVDYTGTGSVNRAYSTTTLAPTYQALAWAPVGDDDAFQRRDNTGSATAYIKTAVEVAALFLVTLPTDNPGGPQSWDVDVKLEFTDRDGSSNAVSYEFEERFDDVLFSPTNPILNTGLADFARPPLLADFATAPGEPPTRERHALSGFWPDHHLRRSKGFTLRTWRVKDTNTSPERTLSLSIKSANASAYVQTNGGRSEFRPRFHMLTWTVISAPFGEREPSVGELGV